MVSRTCYRKKNVAYKSQSQHHLDMPRHEICKPNLLLIGYYLWHYVRSDKLTSRGTSAPQYYHLISGIHSAPFVSHGTAVLNPGHCQILWLPEKACGSRMKRRGETVCVYVCVCRGGGVGRQEGKRLSQRGGHAEVAGGLRGTEAALMTFSVQDVTVMTVTVIIPILKMNRSRVLVVHITN